MKRLLAILALFAFFVSPVRTQVQTSEGEWLGPLLQGKHIWSMAGVSNGRAAFVAGPRGLWLLNRLDNARQKITKPVYVVREGLEGKTFAGTLDQVFELLDNGIINAIPFQKDSQFSSKPWVITDVLQSPDSLLIIAMGDGIWIKTPDGQVRHYNWDNTGKVVPPAIVYGPEYGVSIVLHPYYPEMKNVEISVFKIAYHAGTRTLFCGTRSGIITAEISADGTASDWQRIPELTTELSFKGRDCRGILVNNERIYFGFFQGQGFGTIDTGLYAYDALTKTVIDSAADDRNMPNPRPFGQLSAPSI